MWSSIRKSMNILDRMSFHQMLIVGIIIRVVIMPFVGHPFDVFSWYHIANNISAEKLNELDSFFPVPLWPLTIFVVKIVYDTVGYKSPIMVDQLPDNLKPGWGIDVIPDPVFLFLIKMPAVMADIALAFLLRKMFVTGDLGGSVPKAWFMNPFVIWISAGWGMFDSIPAALSIFSLYYMTRMKIRVSSIFNALGILYKIYPLVFVLPNIASILQNTKRRMLNVAIFMGILFVFLSVSFLRLFGSDGFFPFLVSPEDTFFGYFGFGLTYWSISLVFGEAFPISFAYPIMYSIMAALTGLSLYYVLFKIKYKGTKDWILAYALMLFPVLLSYRLIAEQWFIWILPFLIILKEMKTVGRFELLMVTLIAFVYSHKNFPYYLLPSYSFSGDVISRLSLLVTDLAKRDESARWTILYPPPPETFEAVLPSEGGAIILAILGISFSMLMLLVYLKLIRHTHKEAETL